MTRNFCKCLLLWFVVWIKKTHPAVEKAIEINNHKESTLECIASCRIFIHYAKSAIIFMSLETHQMKLLMKDAIFQDILFCPYLRITNELCVMKFNESIKITFADTRDARLTSKPQNISTMQWKHDLILCHLDCIFLGVIPVPPERRLARCDGLRWEQIVKANVSQF